MNTIKPRMIIMRCNRKPTKWGIYNQDTRILIVSQLFTSGIKAVEYAKSNDLYSLYN